MRFTKMHGLGNDYLYYYGELQQAEEWSKKLSDRHFGIGSDGIITISESSIADFKMRIFNADGSEAKMCGNGIRCVGKYVYEKGYTNKEKLTIETLSGIRTLELKIFNNQVESVKVDMGRAEVQPENSLLINGEQIVFTQVSMGNPHAVIFVDNAENASLETIGATMEKHNFFPEGTNVEFVQKLDENNLRMRVWERGSGITMACGTGACAAVAAAIASGKCPVQKEITVRLDGGELQIVVQSDNRVTMTGKANIICECEVRRNDT